VNISSVKKQGEILCFYLAYLLFADEEQIPCLHSLLNDKKELVYGNQRSIFCALVTWITIIKYMIYLLYFISRTIVYPVNKNLYFISVFIIRC